MPETSAAPARFTFDLDLGRREERNRVVTESAMTQFLADARTAGFAEGFAAGEQGVSAKAARQLATAAGELADRVAATAASLEDTRKTVLAEAVDLAASIAKKLAAGLLQQQPAAEIEALIAECLDSLDSVPHLVIRCHPDLAEAVREIATGRIASSGFAGRLVLMGEPDIASGDCRLEWVDGGLVRDSAAITAAIDEKIAAFLAARGIERGAGGAGEKDR